MYSSITLPRAAGKSKWFFDFFQDFFFAHKESAFLQELTRFVRFLWGIEGDLWKYSQDWQQVIDNLDFGDIISNT